MATNGPKRAEDNLRQILELEGTPLLRNKIGIGDLLGHPGGLWRLRHAMVAHLNQFTSHCFDARVLPGSYSFLSKYTSHPPGQSYIFPFKSKSFLLNHSTFKVPPL